MSYPSGITLKEYLADTDPNKWLRLSTGQMQNLFYEALEVIDDLKLCAEYYAELKQSKSHDNGAYARQKLQALK
jgi:hypothetical protein